MEHVGTQPLAEAFRPDLVNLRRRMLDLSQAELAERAGIAQGTLSKIEQGLRPVTEDVLQRLAEALNCLPSFFSRKDRLYGAPLSAHPLFRKKASVGRGPIEKLVADLNVRMGHIRTLLNSVDLDAELPFPEYDVEEVGSAQDVAKRVRRAWYMPSGPVPDLTEYAERAGVIVVYCTMPDAGIDGVSYRVAGLPPLVFLNEARPADRLRFSLAHEIGHLVMHRYPTGNMEDEADAFASELLMPAEDIGPHLTGLTLDRAMYMKPTWRVSMAALIVRATTLGRIDAGKAQWLWRQMSARGFRTQEPSAVDFPVERSSVMGALLRNLTDNLGYTDDDLEQTLDLHLDELAQMYGLKPKQGLRLIAARP
ncbi:XRE family transcriptional regulator [Cupriavidus sp. DF5525]|uniref:helix-turn-helix domain-containing protein n=1 Tax=Cupriavidus sp. DF5525 TaxID=3160989 RepID=UPI0032E050D8